MSYNKKDLVLHDREKLVELVDELRLKLKKKNVELNLARTRLRIAKARVVKMKDIVETQRRRIIDLYP
jgi:hypothetical protein